MSVALRYLLDTCTVSDFVKGQIGVLSRLKSTPPAHIAVSSITRMEIAFGLQLNPEMARKISPVIDALLGAITVLPFDEADAQAAAAIRAALQRQGRPIGAYDVLLAGSAMARGLIMVTANVGEFERVDGLLVENWR